MEAQVDIASIGFSWKLDASSSAFAIIGDEVSHYDS